jgi:uncharacterized RmlC-like cupin family protein
MNMSEVADKTSSRPDCRVVRTGDAFIGKQGLSYRPAISAENVGAKGIHMQMVVLRPKMAANAHKHEAHETAIYVLSGRSAMWYGDRLEQHLEVGPGDFLFIPADMPHKPYNPSETEDCVALIARTDPNEQESVVLLPEIEKSV